jgi:hypothetical protein
MNTSSVLIGAAAGSALMFMLDPDRGGRRRALLRDQAVRVTRKTRDGFDATSRDLANRTMGVAAAARARLSRGEISDATLTERVRAKLGRVCSHPRAVDVDAHEGHVTLRGEILSSELDDVLAAAAAAGAVAVHNELEAYETSAGVPSLQGDGRTAGSSLDVLQQNWAPATRALVGAGLVATGACIAAAAFRSASEHREKYTAM